MKIHPLRVPTSSSNSHHFKFKVLPLPKLSHALRLAGVLCLTVSLQGCFSTFQHTSGGSSSGAGGDSAPRGKVDVSKIKDPVPHYLPKSKRGNHSPYKVFGKTYRVMKSAKGYRKTGVASWYGTKFHGRDTSSGQPYNMYEMTAAHKHLPLPTFVRVTNLENGRKVIVKVNDRGPFHGKRIIDLSYAAAIKLGFAKKGTAKVHVEAITFDAPKVPNHLASKAQSTKTQSSKPSANNVQSSKNVQPVVQEVAAVNAEQHQGGGGANESIANTQAVEVQAFGLGSDAQIKESTPEKSALSSSTPAVVEASQSTTVATATSPSTNSAVKPAAVPPVSAPTAKQPYLQVSAFSNYNSAARMKQRLDQILVSLGVPVRITTVSNAQKKTLHRVHVGPIPQVRKQQEVRQVLTQHQMGLPILVRF